MSNLHVTSAPTLANGEGWERLLHEQADLELLSALRLVPLTQLDNFIELRFFSKHASDAYIRKMPFPFSEAAAIVLAYAGKGWTRTVTKNREVLKLTGSNTCRRFALRLHAQKQFDSDALKVFAYFCCVPVRISAQEFEEFTGLADALSDAAENVKLSSLYGFGYTDYVKLYGAKTEWKY